MNTAISLGNYIHDVWRCRLFWSSLAVLDLRKKYRRSLLGLGWALMQPLAMTAVVCGVFAGAFQVDFRDHFLFVLTGLCTWNFLSTVVREGCGSIYWSETYIRQHRSPLVIYPLRVVLCATMHFLAALAPVVIWSLCTRNVLFVTLLSLPAMVLLLVTIAWGIATIAGVVTVYFADFAQILDVGLQLAFYGTPIIYGPELLRKRGLDWVVDYNPVAAMAEVMRGPLLEGTLPGSHAVLLLVATNLAVWLTAGLLLWTCERRIIFHL